MADLICVPRSITLGCGGSTKITVNTTDKKANVTVRVLGFDSDVARPNAEEATTNDMGFVDFFITCGGLGQGCPGSTTLTFFAVDYDDDDLLVECVDRGQPPAQELPQIPLVLGVVPLLVAPQLLAEQVRTLQRIGSDRVVNPPEG